GNVVANGASSTGFAIGDALGGRTLHFFAGQGLSPQVPAAAPFTTLLYQYTLASPLSATIMHQSGVDLTPTNPPLSGPVTANVTDAYALEGDIAGGKLATLQNIGDFNGDHFDDFLVSGATTAYVLFGPVNLNATTNIADQADLVIDLSKIGLKDSSGNA